MKLGPPATVLVVRLGTAIPNVLQMSAPFNSLLSWPLDYLARTRRVRPDFPWFISSP